MSKGIKFHRHPEWLAKAPEWVKYRDLYEGRHNVVTGTQYLWPHRIERTVEGGQLRADRQLRTRFLKLPEMIVSLWTSFFFWKPPTIGPKTLALLKDTGGDKDIDGNGTPFVRFWREQVLAQYLQFGKVGVLADAFGDQPKSKGEQVSRKIRPYLQVLPPLGFTDWQRETAAPDRMGKFKLYRYEYDAINERQSLEVAPAVQRKCEIRSFLDGKYTVGRYTFEGDNPNDIRNAVSDGWKSDGPALDIPNFPELPIVMMEDTESWIDGVCEETLRFFNLRSNKDNIEYSQGYEKQVLIGFDANNPDIVRAAGEHTMLCLPADVQFQVIAPVDTSGYERSVADAISTVFKVGLNQFRQLSADSKAVQSDDTIAEEKANTVALVLSTIDDLEDAMNQSMNHYAVFAGQKNFESDISFNREIIAKNFERFVAVYGAFADRLTKYAKVSKAVDRAAVRALELPKDEETEALREIDQAPEVETPAQVEPDPIEKALNGQQEEAPPAQA